MTRGTRAHNGPAAAAQEFAPSPGRDAVWQASSDQLADAAYNRFDCVLQLRSADQPGPYAVPLRAVEKMADNKKNAVLTLANGTVVTRSDLVGRPDTFTAHERIREALHSLHFGPGRKLAVDVRTRSARKTAAAHALYCAIVSGSGMPRFGSPQKSAGNTHTQIEVFGERADKRLERAAVRAYANTFTRRLCVLPGNWLTPARFVEQARTTAEEKRLSCEVLDIGELARMGAGAFTAVAGPHGTGGIVRVGYRPAGTRHAKTVALVGKGVCFDTGGVNAKPHKHMLGMHADMAGAAAALAVVAHAAEHRSKIGAEAWLAIADNRMFREAAAPGDVVKAADGTAIELVHSDAEGRLLLADTLFLCAKSKPAMIVSLATLTGSMIAAVGERMSGVTGTDQALVKTAVEAGESAGERLHPFPIPADYAKQLRSQIADVKQCAVSGDADHILAALLLKRFVGRVPWAHVDLSASTCKGGLGAVATEQTGFGAAWGLHLLELLAAK